MKTLHIVRHGKALQDYQSISDIDRPLVEKGICNNIAIATRIKEKFDTPELIISSPAARTLHTAHIFARVLNYPSGKVQVDDALYMNGEDAALDILYGLPDHIHSVMLVGHNPDFSYLANMFIRPITRSLPTSGVASIFFDATEWKDILHTVKGYETNFP